jgi:cold shock CspA family protein
VAASFASPVGLRGTVAAFDEARGTGTITGDDGTSYEFHCIEILDGTRTIDVGRAVAFRPLPRFGRIQAGAIEKR